MKEVCSYKDCLDRRGSENYEAYSGILSVLSAMAGKRHIMKSAFPDTGGFMYRNSCVSITEELASHAREMPEIHPDDVITMLTVMKAAEEIKGKTDGILERRYHMSQGKLCVMIIPPAQRRAGTVEVGSHGRGDEGHHFRHAGPHGAGFCQKIGECR